MSGALPIRFDAGMHVEAAAAHLVEAAGVSGQPVEGSFNGVTMRAQPGSVASEIVAAWQREIDGAAERYRASPAGQAAKRERLATVARLQAENEALMVELDALDWSSDVAVLDWLCRYQPVSDDMDIRCDNERVVSAFTTAGFRPSENTGARYDESKRENVFRYLVGRALNGLTSGPAIHPILLKFAGQWRARFAPTSPVLRSPDPEGE